MQLIWQTATADISYREGDELVTNILISLFTDARANGDDILPDESHDRRGWWGDSFNMRKVGSKLWLLGREKQMASVLKLAQEYAESALQWMVGERLIQSVTVTATSPERNQLLLTVRPVLLNSTDLPEYSFKATLNGI
ncbi:phage GP46 family protein [Orbaceae bacterium ESL0721]|nr:phage GP46 family protein [Orbaceae bacterium ESL0721]